MHKRKNVVRDRRKSNLWPQLNDILIDIFDIAFYLFMIECDIHSQYIFMHNNRVESQKKSEGLIAVIMMF